METGVNYDGFIKAIRQSGLTIYDPIETNDSECWIPTSILEELLNFELVGTPLENLPLRTRSKVVKQRICRALGYPIPQTFKKTQPRFPSQNFDTYVQKSNNLQIWNEQVSPSRRYVIIQIGAQEVITAVRVIEGDTLAQLDSSGTLTKKYQARMILGDIDEELFSPVDTEFLRTFIDPDFHKEMDAAPNNLPRNRQLLPIEHIFERLRTLVGETLPAVGYVQERRRSELLHRLVCQQLGYSDFSDDGRFPDITHQLIELKLQTSLTIDLGLNCPDNKEAIQRLHIEGHGIRPCDVRYALFFGDMDDKDVHLTHFTLITGEKFFERFPKMLGNVMNQKIQIPLPNSFFEFQSKRIPN